MPEDRAAAERARRENAAARQIKTPTPAKAAVTQVPTRRPTPLRIIGWVAYLLTLAVLAWFVVLWIRNELPKTEQLYPLPGIAAGFLIIGLWTLLGPALYRSRSTTTRAGKYVLAVLLTIIFYPLIVTGLSSFAAWIVSLVPGSPLH